MHVGIDITSVVYQRGVSRYTANLVRALLASDKLNLTLYGSSLRQHKELEQQAEKLKQEAGNKRAHTVIRNYPPSLYNFLWYQVGYPKLRSSLPDIDVFHSWDWLQPPDSELPLVSTIHDLTLLRYPDTAHPKIREMHKKSWKVLKEREAHIIAVSRATKNDIVELLGIPSQRVHVVHEALPLEVSDIARSITETDVETIKTKLELTKPYILFVGSREPRKNLVRLIKAWKPFSQDYQLIVAGEAAWDKTSTESFGKEMDELRFLGRVSDKELSVLYSEASLFAFPSLYEGFGLPILEAFHHGTPVVTSDISSMPEVAGNAAELVNPKSIESIRTGIRTILEESPENQKKRLQRMIIRLQLFDWDKVARETLDVYSQALAAGNS